MHPSRPVFLGLMLLWGALPTGAPAWAQGADPGADKKSKIEAVLRSIEWTVGPAQVNIGDQAELKLPEGHLFTGGGGTRKMLELMENPSDGRELGLITPQNMAWFLIFDYDAIGYVKDADKEELDGEEILESIRKGTEASNEERKRRGWPTVRIVGWHTAPFFDTSSKNLQWCIKGESRGETVVNHNTRLLGRQGVVSANLLVAPKELDSTLPTVKDLLGGFTFKPGKRYAEYKSGDKIAEYGLAALVVGGAVGIAAKVGLLSKFVGLLGKFWKLIILGLVGIGAAIKSIFTGRRRRRQATEAAEAPPGAAEPPPE